MAEDSFGGSFAATYLAAQQAQFQQALAHANEIMANRKQQWAEDQADAEGERQAAQDAWAKDPTNPANIVQQAHAKYYQGLEKSRQDEAATHAAQEKDRAETAAWDKFLKGYGPTGGLSFGTASEVLPADLRARASQAELDRLRTEREKAGPGAGQTVAPQGFAPGAARTAPAGPPPDQVGGLPFGMDALAKMAQSLQGGGGGLQPQQGVPGVTGPPPQQAGPMMAEPSMQGPPSMTDVMAQQSPAYLAARAKEAQKATADTTRANAIAAREQRLKSEWDGNQKWQAIKYRIMDEKNDISREAVALMDDHRIRQDAISDRNATTAEKRQQTYANNLQTKTKLDPLYKPVMAAARGYQKQQSEDEADIAEAKAYLNPKGGPIDRPNPILDAAGARRFDQMQGQAVHAQTHLDAMKKQPEYMKLFGYEDAGGKHVPGMYEKLVGFYDQVSGNAPSGGKTPPKRKTPPAASGGSGPDLVRELIGR